MPFPTEFETLSCEWLDDWLLIVRFDRPDVANALNTQMARDVAALFASIELAGPAIRCVVLTGAGRYFCAGGDFKERDGLSDAEWRNQHVLFERAFYAVMDCPKPVIAAVNGAAFGGGCEFALACDFIFASETARFAQTETRLGIIPGGGGTQNLARAVGARRAKELILSAKPFSAAEAAAWGMVNRVCAEDELLPETLVMAREISLNAPVAIEQAKLAISAGIDLDLRSGLRLEITAYNRTIPTKDRVEGIRAAREKRQPKFTGQ